MVCFCMEINKQRTKIMKWGIEEICMFRLGDSDSKKVIYLGSIITKGSRYKCDIRSRIIIIEVL